jgi:hypothetical protein
LFNFSYTIDNGSFDTVVSGQFEGTLQPDNNTVIVSAVPNFEIDGTSPFSIGFVESVAENFGGGAPADPTVTFDGSFMDIVGCSTSACDEFFFFDFNTSYSTQEYQDSLNNQNPFDSSRYTLTAASSTAVPEPATILGTLAALGFGGVFKGRYGSK